MEEQPLRRSTRGNWSTKKRDDAPRGVFRHPSGKWAIRFTCSAGHIHKEKVGPLKSEADRRYHERRSRGFNEPGWCPRIEDQQKRALARAEQARERARMAFEEYSRDYLAWAEKYHRSYATTKSQIGVLRATFGERKLDEISTADVERFLAKLGERVTPATVNRYRDRLSGMFKRAVRLGIVATNPVKGIEKHKEPGGRVVYLPPVTRDRPAYEEEALCEAMTPDLRPLFTASVHTGLRWSEQVNLRWANVDLHTGTITVPRSKHGEARHVPINSVVRSLLFDLSLHRQRPDAPDEQVFSCRYAEASNFFPKVVEAARQALKGAGKDVSHLEGYTWHGNRHTFASRLVMAGVDPRTVQELGGWKSLKMVQRYTHLSPGHLRAAVERLVPQELSELARN